MCGSWWDRPKYLPGEVVGKFPLPGWGKDRMGVNPLTSILSHQGRGSYGSLPQPFIRDVLKYLPGEVVGKFPLPGWERARVRVIPPHLSPLPPRERRPQVVPGGFVLAACILGYNNPLLSSSLAHRKAIHNSHKFNTVFENWHQHQATGTWDCQILTGFCDPPCWEKHALCDPKS